MPVMQDCRRVTVVTCIGIGTVQQGSKTNGFFMEEETTCLIENPQSALLYLTLAHIGGSNLILWDVDQCAVQIIVVFSLDKKGLFFVQEGLIGVQTTHLCLVPAFQLNL